MGQMTIIIVAATLLLSSASYSAFCIKCWVIADSCVNRGAWLSTEDCGSLNNGSGECVTRVLKRYDCLDAGVSTSYEYIDYPDALLWCAVDAWCS